jgi:hypothetical protein
MPRIADSDRVLRILKDVEGLSNLRVKTELGLADDRYEQVRTELLADNLIEKYVCRGGGVRLTRKGERENLTDEKHVSSVKHEKDLYDPLNKFLERQANEDELEAVICATHNLKARGQWQNPDTTSIAIEYYRHLRKVSVSVTTYEVKQFWRWNVDVVFEAAAHHRFSHEAHVVLEWPNELEFSLTDPTYKIDQIARECQRFGVGLYTMHKDNSSCRLHPRLEARPSTPNDDDVNGWLDYVFSRIPNAEDEFNQKMTSIQNRFGK